MWRPNLGGQTYPDGYKFKRNYRKISGKKDLNSAKALWSRWYDHCEHQCHHMGGCGVLDCQDGTRMVHRHVLCGNVFEVWAEAEKAASKYEEPDKKSIKVVRVLLEDGSRMVGLELPQRSVDSVLDHLNTKARKRTAKTDSRDAARPVVADIKELLRRNVNAIVSEREAVTFTGKQSQVDGSGGSSSPMEMDGAEDAASDDDFE
eukprot:FR735506.1.p1 GENE.FR735506.1~~FR735506.1.p1  ORF type:complete len:204 (-),score=22.18 FR735506.1:60-671(-)